MKKLLCFLIVFSVLPMVAATETASITVPDADAPELASAIEVWIQTQRNDDGTLKYPGGTVAARRQAFLDALLRNGVRRVILKVCDISLPDCPTVVQEKISNKSTADQQITTEVESIVQ